MCSVNVIQTLAERSVVHRARLRYTFEVGCTCKLYLLPAPDMDFAQRNSFRTMLKIEPDAIRFSNVKMGLRYAQSITITNLTAHVRKVRFVAPGLRTSRDPGGPGFRFSVNNKIGISPGLPLTARVEFFS